MVLDFKSFMGSRGYCFNILFNLPINIKGVQMKNKDYTKGDIKTLCKKGYSRNAIIKNFGFDKSVVKKVLKGKRCK